MNDIDLNGVRMSVAVAQAGTLTAATREMQLLTSGADSTGKSTSGSLLCNEGASIRRIWTVAHWLHSVGMRRNNGLVDRCGGWPETSRQNCA